MDDIPKIPGFIPQEPPKESRSPSPTKRFQELMKVKDSGSRQKKKKKRQEEVEEERKALLVSKQENSEKAIEGGKRGERNPKVQKIEKSEKRHSRRPKYEEEGIEEAGEMIAVDKPRKKADNLFFDIKPSLTLPSQDKKPLISREESLNEEVISLPREEKGEQIQEEKIVQNIFKEESTKKEITKKETTPPKVVPLVAPFVVPEVSFIPPSSDTPPPYLTLSSEMLALFERMVGVMSVMQGGVRETTIHLNTPEFASSIFSGAQVIITEFDTAPLTYNIEFLGNLKNSALFEKNISQLRAIFNKGNYRFRVHHIRASLLQADDENHQELPISSKEDL